jgi:hypothetical protein
MKLRRANPWRAWRPEGHTEQTLDELRLPRHIFSADPLKVVWVHEGVGLELIRSLRTATL